MRRDLLGNWFCHYLVDSWTSCPAALGVEKGMSMEAKALDSPSMSRMHIRPGR